MVENIEKLLKEYATIEKEEKQVKEKKDNIRNEILNQIKQEGLTSYKGNDYTVSIVNKETIKYTNEQAIINYCKTHNLEGFVKEVIDTTPFNKELKTKTSVLSEDLKEYFTKTLTETLQVKGNK